MPSLRDRISVYRLVVLVLLAFVVAGLTTAMPDPPRAQFLALTGLVFVFLGASVFDAVREHPLYNLASAAFTALLFGLLYALSWNDSVFVLVLVAVALAGVAVELYNYRRGTSYLRIHS